MAGLGCLDFTHSSGVDTCATRALIELRLADHHGPWRCPGIGNLSSEAFREFARPERMHAVREHEYTPQALVPLDHDSVLFDVGQSSLALCTFTNAGFRTPGFVIRCRPVGLFDRSNGGMLTAFPVSADS